ncbi:hypothetical protein TNCV_2964331 [Trichonephila clavipes]|nr:hypothetical protein TNCV_2964331 [Trichonephila clavipes]
MVSRLWNQFQTNGTVIRKVGQGHHIASISAQDCYLALSTWRHRWTSATQLVCDLASVNNKTGYCGAENICFGHHKEQRHVLLTEELRFTLQSDSRRVFVWKESGACFLPFYETEIDRFGSK